MEHIKRSPFSFMLGLSAIALLLQGCNVKWEVVQDPYANYHRILQRVQIQTNQIDTAANNGSMVPPVAQVLVENDIMIRQLAIRYQSSQSTDLTPSQTYYLDNLLSDNGSAINDALARPDQWAQAFQGAWPFNYELSQDRLLYIACLHYQIDQEQARIDDAYQAGYLTDVQAQELKTRSEVIRNYEVECYNQNGRMDLNMAQIQQLGQMADDNNRYLSFRTHQRTGRWQGDHFNQWQNQRQHFTNHPWTQGGPGNDNSGAGTNNPAPPQYWDGRPVQRAPAKPTSAPVAQAPAVNQGFSPSAGVAPTFTPVPVQAVSSLPTQVPAVSPKGPDHSLHPGGGSPSTGGPNKGQAPASNIQPVSTVSAAASKPVHYLSPDPLQARAKQQIQKLKDRFMKGPGKADVVAGILQKQKAYQKALNTFLGQNQKKGLTQDQMSQLSKMLDDIDKALADHTPSNSK